MSAYSIRPIASDDLQGIVDLHIAAFGSRDHSRKAVQAHHERMLQQHLNDPRDGAPPLCAFVAEYEGAIVGMIYGLSSPMLLHDTRIWSLCVGYYCVHSDHRNPTCTRAVIRAPFDSDAPIVLCDRTNAPARKVGERTTEGHTYPQYSLRWARVLNPGTAALGGILNRNGRLRPWTVPALRGVARLTDKVSNKLGQDVIAIEQPRARRKLSTTELTAQDLAEHGDALLQQFTLRPDITDAALTEANWARFRAVRPEGRIERVGVWNHDGELVGWYILHIAKTGICEVLQLIGRDDMIDGVISLMFDHAKEMGVGSMHGMASPTMFVALSEAGAYYHGRGSAMFMRSTDPTVAEAFSASRALITGFEGEYQLMMAPENSLD